MTRNGLISTAATLGTLLGALSLCGCASDEVASRILVEPERYLLYNCPEIATATKSNMTRQRELEALMIKAGPGTGGQIASSHGLSAGVQPIARGDGAASQGCGRQELQKYCRCRRARSRCFRAAAQ